MRHVDWKKVQRVWQHRPNIAAAWVFGSAQDGVVRAGSDLDFGILFVVKPSLDELTDLRAELQEILGFEAIDVIPLNEGSPVLRFEALSGRCLYCADRERRAAFASLTSREYEDDMTMLAKYVLLER